jgi:hypothetical protein
MLAGETVENRLHICSVSLHFFFSYWQLFREAKFKIFA